MTAADYARSKLPPAKPDYYPCSAAAKAGDLREPTSYDGHHICSCLPAHHASTPVKAAASHMSPHSAAVCSATYRALGLRLQRNCKRCCVLAALGTRRPHGPRHTAATSVRCRNYLRQRVLSSYDPPRSLRFTIPSPDFFLII